MPSDDDESKERYKRIDERLDILTRIALDNQREHDARIAEHDSRIAEHDARIAALEKADVDLRAELADFKKQVAAFVETADHLFDGFAIIAREHERRLSDLED